MSKGRTFDKVEKKMNHIQASLSSSSLIQPETNITKVVRSNTSDNMAIRLKRDLEEKDTIAKKYKINITLVW